MTELRPLLESSDDALERALLGSARSDLPQPLGLRQTALALGLALPTANALAAAMPAASSLGASGGTALSSTVAGSAATGGASGVVGTAAGAATFGALGKSLLGGALVSFMALTAYDQTLGARAQPSAPVASAAGPAVGQPNRIGTPPARPLSLVEPVQEVEAAAVESPVPAVGSRRVSSPVAELPPTADERGRVDAPANGAFAPEVRAQPAPASASASLAAEIRILDQARAALAAGDADQASRLLDAYTTSRHSPTLAQEAALLRVRLLLARGQRPAAAALARRIIAEHPESAHVDSLRSLATEP